MVNDNQKRLQMWSIPIEFNINIIILRLKKYLLSEQELHMEQ